VARYGSFVRERIDRNSEPFEFSPFSLEYDKCRPPPARARDATRERFEERTKDRPEDRYGCASPLAAMIKEAIV
jgi:hypothetical protein